MKAQGTFAESLTPLLALVLVVTAAIVVAVFVRPCSTPDPPMCAPPPKGKLPWPFPDTGPITLGTGYEQYIEYTTQGVPTKYSHKGMDVVLALGTEVRAMEDGTIVDVYCVGQSCGDDYYALTIESAADSSVRWRYQHLDPTTVSVALGQDPWALVGKSVGAGQLLGSVVSFVKASPFTFDHLHLARKVDGNDGYWYTQGNPLVHLAPRPDTAPPEILATPQAQYVAVLGSVSETACPLNDSQRKLWFRAAGSSTYLCPTNLPNNTLLEIVVEVAERSDDSTSTGYDVTPYCVAVRVSVAATSAVVCETVRQFDGYMEPWSQIYPDSGALVTTWSYGPDQGRRLFVLAHGDDGPCWTTAPGKYRVQVDVSDANGKYDRVSAMVEVP